MKKRRVIITGGGLPLFNEEQQAYLWDLAPDAELIFTDNIMKTIQEYDDADALVSGPKLPAEVWDWCVKAPGFKWFHCLISGVDAIMKTPLKDLDITITSTKGIHGPMISDQALAFIFAFLRGVHFWVRGQRDHRWVRDEIGERLDESFNKTVGVVGVGNIGMEVCRKCKALGMRTIGVKRTVIESPYLDACYTLADVDKLFAEADFVVLTCPLTSETEKLINAETLRKMKKNAVVINLARGAVVDHEALLSALDEGIIAGAGLDIFETEPLPSDSPLWDHENIIISHHTAPKTPYLMDRAVKVVGENLVNFLNGKPLNHIAER